MKNRIVRDRVKDTIGEKKNAPFRSVPLSLLSVHDFVKHHLLSQSVNLGHVRRPREAVRVFIRRWSEYQYVRHDALKSLVRVLLDFAAMRVEFFGQ